jgi:dihydrofolate synthase/folylpolyglutamate synthase
LEQKIDYTVLEVGLGGRLDATNVVNPKVSIITRIGYDHIETLGKTLVKIAQEKGGIIHSGSFVIISPQRPSVLKIIKDKIQATHNQYYNVGKGLKVADIKATLSGVQFTVKDNNGIINKYQISLIGKHQIENACTALAVLRHLKETDIRITDNDIKKGLAEAKILARCQVVSKRPLIMVDSAHNPESAQSLYNVIHGIIREKVIIVFGSSRGKLVQEMFRILAPVIKQFILTQSENPRHIPSSELAELISKYSISIPFQTTENVSDAIKQALNLSKGKIPIIITGSFYVAGEALITLKS